MLTKSGIEVSSFIDLCNIKNFADLPKQIQEWLLSDDEDDLF